MKKVLTYASLCTGVGGFDLGFDRAGFRCVLQSEQDSQCRAVLARHWPDVPRTSDVNNDETERLIREARPDAVCFGFPCQDLSVAGKRAGLAGERSGLFFRCLDLAAASGAEWAIIENVVGLLSSNQGRDMGAVLRAMEERGYRWAYRVLDLQNFRVPQRRRRVFIVGYSGERAAPSEVLFEREGGVGDSAPGGETRANSAGGTGGGVAGCLNFGTGDRGFRTEPGEHLIPMVSYGFTTRTRGGVSLPEWNRERAYALLNPGKGGRRQQGLVAYQCHGSNVGPFGTLRRGNGNVTGGVPFTSARDRTAVRRLTPTECERLMGWKEGHTALRGDGSEVSDTARYRMCGNGVGSPVSEWIARRLAKSLLGDAP